MYMRIFAGVPRNGASNNIGVDKERNFRPLLSCSVQRNSYIETV